MIFIISQIVSSRIELYLKVGHCPIVNQNYKITFLKNRSSIVKYNRIAKIQTKCQKDFREIKIKMVWYCIALY